MEKTTRDWDTEDYGEEFKKLAEVGPEGVKMTYSGLTHNHGENNYHALHGIEKDKKVAYLFSSGALNSLLMEIDGAIKGKDIVIVPRGSDMDRRYKIKLA